jgi:hypothetical protein
MDEDDGRPRTEAFHGPIEVEHKGLVRLAPEDSAALNFDRFPPAWRHGRPRLGARGE